MKKKVYIILSIVLLLTISSGAVIYHRNAIDNAYADGNDDGYYRGYSKGRSIGYDEGYDIGYDKGYGYYEDIEDEYRFYHNGAVIVTTTGKKYHRYDCYHIENRNIYIYNIENAKVKGYTPCLDCYD